MGFFVCLMVFTGSPSFAEPSLQSLSTDSPGKTLSSDVSPGREAFLKGELYFDGIEVSRDYEQAAKWYLKGAELGHGIAQYGIATLYERGLGVPEDFEKAVYWYRKAAASESSAASKAQGALGIAFQMGMGVSRDLKEAVRWFSRAAGKDPSALAHLGEAYYRGWGVPTKLNKAFRCLKRAALSGDIYAQGFLYEIDPKKFDKYRKSYGVFRKLKAKRRAFLSYRVVTNTKDRGYGSLRFALETISSGGTVAFHAALGGKTISLHSPLVVDKDVTLLGPGRGIVLSGMHKNRVFSILPHRVVTLENLNVQQGHTTEIGGGIFNGGILILNRCVVRANRAFHGGGIWNDGVLTMNHCSVLENLASGDRDSSGGGLSNRLGGIVTAEKCLFNSNQASLGGAIANGGVLSLTSSLLENNAALEGAGLGGGVRNAQVLSARDTSFIDNKALSGGGMENGFAATAMLENITLSGNVADKKGGGIANSEGFLIANAVTVTLNNASSGGGLYTGPGGTTRLRNAAIGGNHGSSQTCPTADVEGAFRSLGYLVFGILPQEYGTLLSETDLEGTVQKPLDILLEPLDDCHNLLMAGALGSEGAIPSHLPARGSPLLDRIPVSEIGCNEAPDTDQCGLRRPLLTGQYGDVGAREKEVLPETVSVISDVSEDQALVPPQRDTSSQDLPEEDQ